jgi:hypothetical protein
VIEADTNGPVDLGPLLGRIRAAANAPPGEPPR